MALNPTNCFVANDAAGTRKETAILLVGTAREFDIPQREIASARTGFYISERLAEILEREMDEGAGGVENAEPTEQPATTPKKKASKKTSGNRAEKTNS